MASYKFDSAGMSAQELGTLGPIETPPIGTSAGIIGTSIKGPAFVPLTLGSFDDFSTKFGGVDESHFGPLAASEWLRNANSVTYLRLLGIGDGKKRSDDGEVKKAGFTVGEDLPSGTFGTLLPNPFANLGGPPGRTYFLGCFMSESAGSTFFSSAGIQGTGSYNGIVSQAVPIVRGILMAPSGVILRLSASGGGGDNAGPSPSLVADESTSKGTSLGSVILNNGTQSTQDFVLLLNGFNNPDYETVVSASLDILSPYYVTNTLNTDPTKIQERGHYLASHWDLHPSMMILTGTGVVVAGADAPEDFDRKLYSERSIFLLTSSLQRDVGNATVPNYESFRNRFTHARTPWFTSQAFRGKSYDLFRFHALDSGTGFSNSYKVTIANLTPPDEFKKEPYSEASIEKYGTFDVILRRIDDPDSESSIPIETFVGLSLNPADDRYICKAIGDINVYYDFDRPEAEQRLVFEGNYPLKSRYVRVEVSDRVSADEIPPLALPLGVRGIQHLITSGTAPMASLGGTDASALITPDHLRNLIVPPLPFRMNNRPAAPLLQPSPLKTWGVMFDHVAEDSNDVLLQNNASISSMTAYYPDNSTTNINFTVADNTGAPDTAANGVVDVDRFCRNLFTLENIKIVTGSSGYVDPPENWKYANYVRDGIIVEDDVEKVRRVDLRDFNDASSRTFLTYTTLFQGGFDGLNIFDKNETEINNLALAADMMDPKRGYDKGPNVLTHRKAIDIMGNTTSVDISLLAIPGVRVPVVTDHAIDMAESRQDVMYVMDIENGESMTEAIGSLRLRGLNSSYVAAYYPDVVIKPSENSILEITAPPSTAVLGAISLNDSIGAPWFAPAGATRGKLTTTLNPTVNLKENDLDSLYNNDINPIYSATNINALSAANISGVVVWGQKTMQRAESAMDRVNVRRLLIEVRRAARRIALQLIFEPNRESTLTRFNTAMSSELQRIQSRGGLENYRVDVNTSTTSANDVENNTIRGRVYIQPKKTIEFLSIDFIVSNGLQSEL